MRKLLLLIFVFLCFTSITACKSNNGTTDADTPYFTGKVIELYDKNCFIEVTDTGNGNFETGTTVQVHTNISGCPSFDIGDYLTIYFDGKVAYSYPPQLTNVIKISKLDAINS